METGCIFCNRLASSHDLNSLILHRGEYSFVIMNLFPYNTGHIMLVPNQHASGLEELSQATLHEMGELLPLLTSALRRVFDCDGFNIGLNIGAIAGAGVAAHLHQHIVPRWTGDANFMPILASTMVIPETIPVTYAKIRAEIDRYVLGATRAHIVFFDQGDGTVLLRDDAIPTVALDDHVPVWKSVISNLPVGVSNVELAGWAGSECIKDAEADLIGLTLRGTTHGTLPDGWTLSPVNSPDHDASDQRYILRAQAQLAPVIRGGNT